MRSGSPDPGLTLPPSSPTVHLRHATPRGREIRGSENRLRDARHACTCSFDSADSCAPVRVASSRVDPAATFADRALAPCHTKGSRNQGHKIACAIAVALSDTLTYCTRQPAHSRRRFSMFETRSHRPPAPLLRVTTNSGAASASGTRYFQDARPYPHPPPAPSPMRFAMRSIPSTPRHEHRLRRVRCTCMRP